MLEREGYKKIPPGKKVRILGSGIDQEWIMDSELTLPFRSNYTQLMESVSNPFPAAINTLSQVTGLPIAGFKQQYLQVWESTEPLNINLVLTKYVDTGDIFLGFNTGRKLVSEIRDLINITLPKEGNLSSIQGGLIPPGPSIIDALLASFSRDPTNEVIGAAVDSLKIAQEQRKKNTSTGIVAFYIGERIVLGEMIIKNVIPTFSSEVDEAGYPISAQIEIESTSTFGMTDKYLKRVFQ